MLYNRPATLPQAEAMPIEYVGIFGVKNNITSVRLNGKTIKFYYDEKIQVKSCSQTKLQDILIKIARYIN